MTISRASLFVVVVASLATLAACQKAETPALDTALRNDLSLASQAQPYQPQMYVSPPSFWKSISAWSSGFSNKSFA